MITTTTRFMKNTLFSFLLFVVLGVCAQTDYGITTPDYRGYEYQTHCGPLETVFNNTRKEISFGVRQDAKMNLYFQFNDKSWFKTLFENPKDGLAINVVTKDIFDCGSEAIPINTRGEVLKPVYRNHLYQGVKEIQSGYYHVFVGKLPAKYYRKELEFNVLFLRENYNCRYQTFYNLNSYNYDLLDMGLYLDSISYDNEFASIASGDFEMKYKTLRFKVPFEKNKSSFAPADIKPLYDLLRLTDFSIKKIEIQAYSSVEGSKAANTALQEKRAQSIVTALQSFQKPNIETQIASAENWVEFLNDIQETEYAYLADLPKREVKQELVGELVMAMEPYLNQHRKALITLYLQRKDEYDALTKNQLVETFNTSIVDDRLSEAEKLQNSLFNRIRAKEVDPEVLHELKIPKQKKYIDFFNANSAFRYRQSANELLTTYYDFQELNQLYPENKKVAYNMLALKLRMNHSFKSIPEEENLIEKIRSLEKMGINKGLVLRMLVNYHITKSELLMKQGKYDEKDKAVRFILDTYDAISLSDLDYLSLAQFLTYYYDRESAVELLTNKVKDIDIDKRLLFYYLNLTLIDDELTQNSQYRTIMLNAVNLDQSRFCKIFDSSIKGGVTFQLLDNAFLKKTYCENCTE